MVENGIRPDENFESSLTVHNLRGEVRKVVFESSDGAYSVLKVIDDQGVEHTVTGPIFGAYAGQGVEVSGSWERHKEHGRQFKARDYKFVLPTTSTGVERYLASGIIPGIGPKLAKCIVNKFQANSLDIMDRYSARLKEIPGFGKKRVAMIKKAWDEHAERRNVYIYMQGLGISAAYCARIYKTYGDTAGEIVRENPYQLADDVKGIGFLMADKVAASQGIGKDNPQRLAAGVLYALKQLRMSGHTCYPEEDFFKYAGELLDVDSQGVSEGLKVAIEAEKAVADPSVLPGHRMIYDEGMFRAENELPKILNRLLAVRSHRGAKILGVKTPPTISLSEEQMHAVERVGHGPISIITGGPGVGKTTVVSEIVRRASAANLKVYLAAPTGRAAKRLSESSKKNAMTIHRMLKWEPAKGHFAYGYKMPLKCDLLIVDEVSMLDLPLAVYLFRAVELEATVVLVGDSDQLPSVGPGKVLDDLIRSGRFPVTRLSQIFRQGEGSRIIVNAHAVNAGRIPEIPRTAPNELADFYWIEQEDPEQVVDLIARMVKDRIPQRFGFQSMTDIQILTPMNRGGCGTRTLNELLQHELNPGHKPQFKIGEKTFKAGDKVMQTSNNYDKNVFNGDMGRIHNVNLRDKEFFVRYDSSIVQYGFDEADQITLAYAITVHKSQGSEFPCVIVPMLGQHYMMLQRKLLYTAMTRAKKLLILIGSKKAVSMSVRNTTLEPRYSMLLQRLNKGE